MVKSCQSSVFSSFKVHHCALVSLVALESVLLHSGQKLLSLRFCFSGLLDKGQTILLRRRQTFPDLDSLGLLSELRVAGGELLELGQVLCVQQGRVPNGLHLEAERLYSCLDCLLLRAGFLLVKDGGAVFGRYFLEELLSRQVGHQQV